MASTIFFPISPTDVFKSAIISEMNGNSEFINKTDLSSNPSTILSKQFELTNLIYSSSLL
jgi:hypothetical protein